VFAFPSPVETEGLVAMEANACGTPVVGVDSGALSDTIVDGKTGFTYPEGDIDAFRGDIERALAEYDDLRETCLDHRDSERRTLGRPPRGRVRPHLSRTRTSENLSAVQTID